MPNTNPAAGWPEMTPDDFGEVLRPVQGALIPEPDPCGTLDLFDTLDD